MAALLSQAKIAFASPIGNFEEAVIRFQTDSYSVRATQGINPNIESWEIIWAGLTAAEATSLKGQLNDAAGVTIIDYTSPLSGSAQKWTCTEHSAEPYPGPAEYWTYTAILLLENDL